MEIFSLILLFLIIFSVCHMVFAAYCTRVFFRATIPLGTDKKHEFPPVSIIKPVSGMERGYRENFVSFCAQDYPEFEILFALSENADRVIRFLEGLKESFPDREIRWIAVNDPKGPNYKVGNLIGATREARHDTLIFSDSDMRVGPEYLKNVAPPLLREGVGLVTCLYRNPNIDNVFSALEALSVQTDFIPNVLFDRQLEDVSYAFGSTICTSKKILSEVGGLESLLDYLADDYQMGNRVRKAGYRIVLSSYLIDHAASIASFGQYLHHQLRTAITQRVCRPLGYFGSIVTHGVSLALLLWLIQGISSKAGALFFFVCGLRILSAAYLNRIVIRNRELSPYLWLIPFNDLLKTIFWFLSLFVNTVHWKDRRFRVRKGGKMVEWSNHM